MYELPPSTYWTIALVALILLGYYLWKHPPAWSSLIPTGTGYVKPVAITAGIIGALVLLLTLVIWFHRDWTYDGVGPTVPDALMPLILLSTAVAVGGFFFRKMKPGDIAMRVGGTLLIVLMTVGFYMWWKGHPLTAEGKFGMDPRTVCQPTSPDKWQTCILDARPVKLTFDRPTYRGQYLFCGITPPGQEAKAMEVGESVLEFRSLTGPFQFHYKAILPHEKCPNSPNGEASTSPKKVPSTGGAPPGRRSSFHTHIRFA